MSSETIPDAVMIEAERVNDEIFRISHDEVHILNHTQRKEAIARALLAAEQRGMEKAGQSLAKAEQALKDWLHVYAPDLCDPEEVLAAQGRIGTQGTIAYIADALAAIRSLGGKT